MKIHRRTAQFILGDLYNPDVAEYDISETNDSVPYYVDGQYVTIRLVEPIDLYQLADKILKVYKEETLLLLEKTSEVSRLASLTLGCKVVGTDKLGNSIFIDPKENKKFVVGKVGISFQRVYLKESILERFFGKLV